MPKSSAMYYLHRLFSAEEMVCTHTLYNEVWAGSLDISLTELPETMKRKAAQGLKPREHKKSWHRHFSEARDRASAHRGKIIGKVTPWSARGRKEVATLLEKKTENYIAIRIPGKDADSFLNAMQSLRENSETKLLTGLQDHYRGQRLGVLCVQSGSRTGLCSLLCASLHLMTSPNRTPQRLFQPLFRRACPLRLSALVFVAADEWNGRPRKKLGYRTPRNCFDEFSTLFTPNTAVSPGREASGFHPDRRSDSLSSTVQVSNLHLQFA